MRNNQHQASVLLRAYEILGRFPTWSEFEHLQDIQCDFPLIPEPMTKNGRVFCDVTQFLKQTKLTGIQRVVNAFRNLEIENFQLVYFLEGRFFLFEEESHKSNLPFRKQYYQKIESFKSVLMRSGFYLWTKFLSRVIGRQDSRYSGFVHLLKRVRNRLLPKSTSSNELQVRDFISGSLFIPDLPAERDHLETILVLSKNLIMPVDIFLHDAIPLTFPELMPINSTNEFNLYLKVVCHSTKLFCSSNRVKNDIQTILPVFRENDSQTPSIEVHPFPLVGAVGGENNLNKKEMKIYQKITADKKPFVYAVGTILSRKNYALINRSIDLLLQKNIHCRFIIFAHHDWGDKAFSLSRVKSINEYVTVLHNASDRLIQEISKKSIAMVYPSLVEGFGLPINEAIANSTRVIVNDIDPMNSFAEQSTLVHLAKPNSSEDWARVISVLLNDQSSAYLTKTEVKISWEEWAKNFVIDHLIHDSLD